MVKRFLVKREKEREMIAHTQTSLARIRRKLAGGKKIGKDL